MEFYFWVVLSIYISRGFSWVAKGNEKINSYCTSKLLYVITDLSGVMQKISNLHLLWTRQKGIQKTQNVFIKLRNWSMVGNTVLPNQYKFDNCTVYFYQAAKGSHKTVSEKRWRFRILQSESRINWNNLNS